MKEEVLGIDIGGVIIDRVNDKTDTSFFGNNYLHTTAVPEVFLTIRRLIDERFHQRVILVSKCGEVVEGKTLHWLEYHGFCPATGVLQENIFFTRTREGKAPLCEKLGITHFIDDRLEVLSHLKTVEHQFLFRGRQKEIQEFAHHLPKVQQVQGWSEIARILLPDVSNTAEKFQDRVEQNLALEKKLSKWR